MSGILDHQDAATTARLERIAAGIFARHGESLAQAQRAGGWTNATWLAGDLALRLAPRPGGETIRREAALGALLPAEAGYPQLIAAGVTDGHEWALARRLPGEPLEQAWPALDWETRAGALRQVWARAEAVHAAGEQAAALAGSRAWFNAHDPAAAAESLDRLAAQGLFQPGEQAALRELLACFWQALAASETLLAPAPVLNHGDLTASNVLWHQGRVSGLLDFEFALRAPPQLDLNTLLKLALGPEPPHPLMARAAAEIARPLLAQPGGWELLAGYAALLELWLLQDWLAHPEGEGPLETWEPYRRLRSLAAGPPAAPGYLAALRDAS